MNRHNRRAPAKRNWKVGDASNTVTAVVGISDGTRALCWFVVPEGMTIEQAFETQELHGPFASEEEAEKDSHLVLLGPDCKVKEGGMWNPAWDKPQ